MCGIFGWISPNRAVPTERVARATNIMRHRGPDDEGYLLGSLDTGRVLPAAGDESVERGRYPHWREVGGGFDFAFGFRRLSIQDLSPAGHQPMGTADGKLWIVFNGEVYNFIELRAELEQSGIVFSSGSDTEVILQAYAKWGPSCLSRFNGMWGLAIADLREAGNPKFFIARDRLGVKPLYYAESGEGIIFASELKAVIAARGKARPDALMVGNFLAWGRMSSARYGDTFVEGIRQLAPGCFMTFEQRTMKVQRYWEVAMGSERMEQGDALAKLRWLLDDAVRLRLRADVPVGSCLSGGLDSSAIVGSIDRLSGGGAQQHTFSAVYDSDGPYNEKQWVDRVLAQVNAEGHLVYPTGEELVQDFDRMVWHHDEPFTTTSIFAQWTVMKSVAKAGVKVLLDGQGSDELFGGYRPWRWWLRELIQKRGFLHAWKQARQAQRATNEKTTSSLLAALPMAMIPENWVRTIARKGYLHALNREARILTKFVAKEVVSSVEDPHGPESYPWRHVTDGLEQHLRGLVQEWILPGLLRFEDRNSMAFAVEARVPFTDFRMVEFAFSGALDGLKMHEGWPKWCLRKASAGLVSEDVLWRKDKMGFGTPENWLVRTLSRSRGQKMLERLAPYADIKACGRLVLESGAEDSCGKAPLRGFRVMVAESWLDSVEQWT